MVTVTTPSRANAVPSYCGTAPEPLTNAPPWIHTSTGRPVADGSGVQTLRLSTSSPGTTGSGSSRSTGAGYGRFGRGRAVLGAVADAVPPRRRHRRGEPQVPEGRRGVRDALEGDGGPADCA